RSHPYGKNAAIIGEVTEGSGVIMRTRIGGERFIEPPMGDPVPRVC
ncbi:MAG TPA: hydrogenase expression/formation protein HypE, partial [Methanocorpusculum sp.]|nr:hydrogenase expression/formation protein HypE [Methanocorpusculum sp.]